MGISTSQRSRTQRLDDLPFTRAHGRLLGGAGIGWALDAMDVGLISFVMVALGQQWQLSSGTLSLIASLGFVGMAVGASVGGLLADRVGRRQVFALSLLVYGAATGASALVTSVAMLMILRFLVGLGLGAELPVASTLVSEYSPRHIRGRMVVALESFWAVGWILAALIGYFVVPTGDNGWRWALAVGVVPTLYAVYVRCGLPESARFLEKDGRHDEAEAAVRHFEASAGLAPGEVHPSAVERAASEAATAGATQAGAGGGARTGARESIWGTRLRTRTAALWIVWFMVNLAYYGAFIWLPSLIFAQGFDMVHSFGYTLIITLAQVPGYALAAWLIEVIGRRWTLVIFLVGSAVAAGAFGTADTVTSILVAGCALSFFNLGAWGALYAISPEVYPTSIRGVGTGAAAAFGRVASIIAPLSVPDLLDLGGQWVVFAVFAGAFAIAAIAALALPETANRVLDD